MSKHAKIFKKNDLMIVQKAIEEHVRPENRLRMRLMVSLSAYAGLRACEIASLTLDMAGISFEDAQVVISDYLELTRHATKGKVRGRKIRLHPDLKKEILDYYQNSRKPKNSQIKELIVSNNGNPFSNNMVTVYLFNLYKKGGLDGYSSHSGRRSFITKMARELAKTGGSLRDIQQLAGHSSLITTQKYIEGDEESKIKMVEALKY